MKTKFIPESGFVSDVNKLLNKIFNRKKGRSSKRMKKFSSFLNRELNK